MSNVVIIPSRMDSSRFPGKPMLLIAGMPMIAHCYYRAKMADGIDKVYIATCDEIIFNYIKSIGGSAIMTSKLHTRASSRTSEALEIISSSSQEEINHIVMVQGDEPLLIPDTISRALDALNEDQIDISNVMCKFKEQKYFENRNNIKVVVNKMNQALYFSRAPIPFEANVEEIPCYMQTGIIGFSRESLLTFNKSQETMLEKVESVDMNRILETGKKVKMVLSDSFTIGVDTNEELELVESEIQQDQFLKKYIHL